MSKAKRNPLAVYCSGCGAPAEYDIVHQEYHCRYCGGKTDIREPVRLLGKWRDARKKEILREKNAIEEKSVCQNCGAEVIIPKGEAMGACEFCGGKFVRRAFVASELPEVIIPFVLTEEEARGRLTEWAQSNRRQEEAKAVQEAAGKLRGYYLPYELIRGPVTAEATRKETFSDREYHVGGFLNGLAVNTSKQLDNLVLEGMEPFEWTEARPFEFAFIAGQRVKLSDIDAKKTEARVLEEVGEGFRPAVEKQLQTTGITMRVKAGEILRLPALLPAYVLKTGPVLAVVNGQTGRVAVSKTKAKKVLSWLIEPALLTLIVAALSWYWAQEVMLTFMLALVSGLIFFTAFSDGRGEEFRRVVFKTEKSRAERVQSRLTVTQGEDAVEDTAVEAVFMEPVGGKMVPVKISFYTPFRVLMTILGILVFNGLPAIIAWMMDTEGVARYEYNVGWMCLTVPVTVVLLVAVGRIRVYNYPVLKQILPEGGTKSVTSDMDQGVSFSPVEFFTDMKEEMGWGPMLALVGFLLFLLLGTVGAILTPD